MPESDGHINTNINDLSDEDDEFQEEYIEAKSNILSYVNHIVILQPMRLFSSYVTRVTKLFRSTESTLLLYASLLSILMTTLIYLALLTPRRHKSAFRFQESPGWFCAASEMYLDTSISQAYEDWLDEFLEKSSHHNRLWPVQYPSLALKLSEENNDPSVNIDVPFTQEELKRYASRKLRSIYYNKSVANRLEYDSIASACGIAKAHLECYHDPTARNDLGVLGALLWDCAGAFCYTYYVGFVFWIVLQYDNTSLDTKLDEYNNIYNGEGMRALLNKLYCYFRFLRQIPLFWRLYTVSIILNTLYLLLLFSDNKIVRKIGYACGNFNVRGIYLHVIFFSNRILKHLVSREDEEFQSIELPKTAILPRLDSFTAQARSIKSATSGISQSLTKVLTRSQSQEPAQTIMPDVVDMHNDIDCDPTNPGSAVPASNSRVSDLQCSQKSNRITRSSVVKRASMSSNLNVTKRASLGSVSVTLGVIEDPTNPKRDFLFRYLVPGILIFAS